MTKTAAPPKGMKIITLERGVKREVPESLQIGKHSYVGMRPIGLDCVIGDNVELHGELGSNVTIGDDCDLAHVDIPTGATIGRDVTLRGRVELPVGITIGDNVTISGDVDIRPGVNIPVNWVIKYDCTVNPGPNGFPVVIVAPPEFHCNVRSNDRGF